MSNATLETVHNGPVAGIPGAVVREVDNLPEHLPGATRIGPYTEAAPGALLFEVPGVARFLIRDGNLVEVQPAAGADRDAIAIMIHSSARGTLVHQRGELALNAATLVAPNFRSVAICGQPSFGKSTLAAELCRRGWILVADDVTRVTWNGSMAVVWPSDDRLRLWRDSCELLGYATTGLARVRQGLEVFHVPVSAASAPTGLSMVVRLRFGGGLQAAPLPHDLCTSALFENTIRVRQIEPLGRAREHAQIVSRVSGVVRAFRLDGARRSPVSELADKLAEIVR